jgi:hypothetical protein
MMSTMPNFGLPRDLGDGLLLRWGTPEDVEDVAAFNVRVHGDNPDEPEMWLDYWTRDLMHGRHPTTGPRDFTVVLDTRAENQVVSSLVLIGQTWAYDGIPFGCGRPELIGTDPAYRRRGLVRAQMEAVHAKSAARGDWAQAITGIPWYYRRFGYEMAMNLHGGREFFWARPGNAQTVEPEPYRLRPATEADLPDLAGLYAVYCADHLVSCLRTPATWRFELLEAQRESVNTRHLHLITTPEDETVGYVEFRQWGAGFVVRELAVQPGHSLRAACLFLTRALRRAAEQLNPARNEPITNVSFALGAASPVYTALGRQLEKQRRPYAWYLRVPALPGFLRHIAPALERRLAQSVAAGHSGTLRLNLYTQQITLVFAAGRLQEVGTFTPRQLEEGDALFPDLSFLQLLFGYRSFAELDEMFPDCYAENAETAVLLEALFPKRPSNLIPLA